MVTEKKSYPEKLLDPKWQRLKGEILIRDDYKCQVCGNDKVTLHVHHKVYRHCEPWEYNHDELLTVCANCHEKQHSDLDPKKGIFYVIKVIELILKKENSRYASQFAVVPKQDLQTLAGDLYMVLAELNKEV